MESPLSASAATFASKAVLAPAPPCRSSQLSASLAGVGVATGHTATTIAFTNQGHTCRFSGYPNLGGTNDSSEKTVLHPSRKGFFPSLTPTDLKGGQKGQLVLGTGDACSALNSPNQTQVSSTAAGDTYTAVTIQLPHKDGSLTVSGLTIDVSCGLSETPLGVKPLAN